MTTLNNERMPRDKRSSPSDAPEGLRARHKRDKRERLRNAAWELFTDVGFESATTRAIAERAGVAAGTLFLYAKDKPDLLFLVFEHRLAETVDLGFETLPRDAMLVDQLIHVFSLLFAMYDKNQEVARHFIKELPGSVGPNAQRVNELTFVFLGRMAGLIEDAQKRGEVRLDALPLLAGQAIFSLYYMALLSFLTGFSTRQDSVETMLRPSLELLMHGLHA
jgi:TetR/AcrR family transcriptional regulator, cholesterol catabolism regulator